MVIDDNLSWKEQISCVKKKLNKSCFILKQLKHKLSIKDLLVTYCSLFQSQLYAIEVWGNSNYARDIFVIQKRAVRAIFSLKTKTSCKKYLKKNKILTVPALYIFNVLKYINKNLHNFKKHGDAHNYITRNRNKLSVLTHSTEYYKRSVEYAGIILHNNLHLKVKGEADHRVFRRKCKRLLLEISPYKIDDFILNSSVLPIHM